MPGEEVSGAQLLSEIRRNNSEMPFKRAIDEWLATLKFAGLDLAGQLALTKKLSTLSCVFTLPISERQAQSILFQATQHGLLKLAQIALRSGADPNGQDASRQTPLHILAKLHWYPQRDAKAVFAIGQELFAAKADPDIQDQNELTALHYLIGAGQHLQLAKQMIALLADKGADLEVKDTTRGETPLDRAIRRDQPEIFIQLVEKGAGRWVHPEKAIDFVTRNLKVPGMKTAFEQLQKQSSQVAWLTTLSTITQPDPPGEKSFKLLGCRTGTVYLCPDLVARLHFNKEGRLASSSSEKYGRRTVVALEHHSKKLHLKENPELPGIEYAVGSLTQRVIGHGTSQTELFKAIDRKGHPYPLLASQTIAGKNLQDVLTSSDANELLACLDPERLHNMILMAMIINPEDGKPDNYILTDYRNEQKQIIGIDNDHAFVEPLLKTRLGRTQLQVKCILYCLDTMKQPVTEATRNRFLTCDPSHILRDWLEDLAAQQERYNRTFSEQERRQLYRRERKNPIVIPIPFAPRSIARLYERFTRLQDALRQHPNFTLLELLRHVSPPLGIRYEEAFEAGNTPLERFDNIAGKLYSKAIAGRYSTKVNSRQILKSMQIPEEVITKHKTAYGPRQAIDELERIHQQKTTIQAAAQTLRRGNTKPFHALLLDEYREKVVALIDFSRLRQNEKKVLQAIVRSQTAFRHLSFKGSKRLDNKTLSLILQASPTLVQLNLSGCTSLTVDAIRNLARVCPYLEKLDLSEWKALRELRGARIARKLRFANLRRLNLDGCVALKNLSASFPKLTHFSLRYCKIRRLDLVSDALHTLIADGSRLLTHVKCASERLQFLSLKNCENLTTLELASSRLATLNLISCKQLSLQTIRTVISRSLVLEKVDITSCIDVASHPLGKLLFENPMFLTMPETCVQELAEVPESTLDAIASNYDPVLGELFVPQVSEGINLSFTDSDFDLDVSSLETWSSDSECEPKVIHEKPKWMKKETKKFRSSADSFNAIGTRRGLGIHEKSEFSLMPLCASLVKNTNVYNTLVTLHIEVDTTVGHLAVLTQACRRLPSLQTLALRVGWFEKSDFQAVARYVASNPRLYRLDMCGTWNGEGSLSAIDNAIRSNRSLRHLAIGTCRVSSLGSRFHVLQQLAKAVIANHTLISFSGGIEKPLKIRDSLDRQTHHRSSISSCWSWPKEVRLKLERNRKAYEKSQAYQNHIQEKKRRQALIKAHQTQKHTSVKTAIVPKEPKAFVASTPTIRKEHSSVQIGGSRQVTSSTSTQLKATSSVAQLQRRVDRLSRLLFEAYPVFEALNPTQRRRLLHFQSLLMEYQFADTTIAVTELRRGRARIERAMSELIRRGRLRERKDWAELGIATQLASINPNGLDRAVKKATAHIVRHAFYQSRPLRLNQRLLAMWFHKRVAKSDTTSGKGKERC